MKKTEKQAIQKVFFVKIQDLSIASCGASHRDAVTPGLRFLPNAHPDGMLWCSRI